MADPSSGIPSHYRAKPDEPQNPFPLGTASTLSLSYLAQLSRRVYQQTPSRASHASGDAGMLPPEDSTVYEVGADRCSVHELECGTTEQQRILVVAIGGTSSPLQHVLNVMPHAYQGLYAVGRALSTNEDDEGTASRSNAGYRSHGEAYRAGHEQGWEDPALGIFEQVVRVCRDKHGSHAESKGGKGNSNAITSGASTTRSSNSSEANPTSSNSQSSSNYSQPAPLDLNALYDAVVFAGHSRGGLLAVYAGLACIRGHALCPPYTKPVRVVGFGMPPPLRPLSNEEASFCQSSVVSVSHRRDPVANLGWNSNAWSPTTLRVGSDRPDPKPPSPPQRAAPAAAGGFWGALGNLVQTAVTAVGDTASELAADIDRFHSVGGYQDCVTPHTSSDSSRRNEPSSKPPERILPRGVASSSPPLIEPKGPLGQWVLNLDLPDSNP